MPTPSLVRPQSRVLLVESDAWDAGLIQEALDELEEQPVQTLLPWRVELYHTETLAAAISALTRESFEVVLLNLDLTDSQHLHTFLRIRPFARNATIVLLCRAAEEHTALTAVREGAFAYLMKEDLDCIPLARLLRVAIERQQAVVARAELPLLDELTNLVSRDGFVLLGEQSLQLAARWNLPATLFLIQLAGLGPPDTTAGQQARELLLLETGDLLRRLFHESDIVARLREDCFGALCFGEAAAATPLGSHLRLELAKHQSTHQQLSFVTGQASLQPSGPTHLDVLLESAERSLCENRHKVAATQ